MYTVRELSLRLVSVWIICILFTGFFAYIARSIHLQTISSFDEPIIDFVQSAESKGLTSLMKLFTTIGSTTSVALLAVLTLGVLLWKKHRDQAVLFAIALAGTGILNQVLKFIFKRERPNFHRLIDIGGYSFPSGHTMMAFSLYTILAYIVWRDLKTTGSRIAITILAVFMIIMIAVSRIYLGVHFPSDIVGGLLASSVFLFGVILIYQRFQRQK
ncbi:phosphatase PAP2 family protein [Sporosarcina sp. P34]|nr:phosphatase PAP2 family protein [Sporosarcina sp. P34]